MVLAAAAMLALALIPLGFAYLQLGYHEDVAASTAPETPGSETIRLLERAVYDAGGEATGHPWAGREGAVRRVNASLAPRERDIESAQLTGGVAVRIERNASAASDWAREHCPSGPGRLFGDCEAIGGMVVQERADETHLLAVAYDLRVVDDRGETALTVVVRGFVGQRLVPALLDAGHEVSVLVRDRTRYDAPDGVAVYEGDVLEPAGLDDALAGVDAAYYLIHAMGGGRGFEERDRRGARNFASAAEAAGVDRVIYLSGLGVSGDDLSAHLRSRREVEAVLGRGAYELTVLRAAIIVGHGSASFRIVRQLSSRLPVMITPRWVSTRVQPIAIADVIAYLVGVLDAPETAGGTFEIGGPEVLTYREMLSTVGRILTGREPYIVPVPVLTPRLSAYWVDLVTDVPAGVAHPLIDGMATDVVVTDDRIRSLVPVELTPFETAVERAIDEETAGSGGH